jgi:D-3-phosphoglycerate dehydrogenase
MNYFKKIVHIRFYFFDGLIVHNFHIFWTDRRLQESQRLVKMFSNAGLHIRNFIASTHCAFKEMAYMSYKVLITEDINEAGKELLREQGYEIRMGTGIDEETVLKEASDCDAILTRNATISRRIMENCPKLKAVSMHGVGVNGIDVKSATELGIQVTNAAKANQNSVAEYTIGLILLLAKRTFEYNEGLKAGNWEIRSICGMDLEGKTLGIIGVGTIGTMVAKKAFYGLGMNVIGHKRRLTKPIKTEYGILTNDLDEVIRSADFLSLHVPLTSSTRNLLSAEKLALMKPTAYLINTARGEVTDEKALTKILAEKKIAGAAIDVFDGGIPNMNNPILHLDNVIVSPHTASFTGRSLERMSYQAALGIVETLKGQVPTFPVNNPNPIDKAS